MATTPLPIDLAGAYAGLGFLPDRVPDDDRRSAIEGGPPWFANLATYRDGGIFIVHYAGDSEWERHPHDEVVMVVDGATTMTLIVDGVDHEVSLSSQQLVVVPAETWHRFHTPDGARVLTVTPLPTDHVVADPRSAAES